MRKFLTWLIVVPLGVIFVAFAIANRHAVPISFNPFYPSDPALAYSLPLFEILFVVAILGVVAGGGATWFGQRHWRRAARQNRAEARAARAELANLQAATAARRDSQRLPALSGAGPYGVAGQDNPRATL